MLSITHNGITLIALVITIIVMLILVSVTISMAVNGGLFGYAGRAASETRNAKDQELLLSNGIVGGKTIEDWVQGVESLLPNTTIPAGGAYARLSTTPPTVYYSEITDTQKALINGLLSRNGYPITFDNLEYVGETVPEGTETMDAYFYGDYVYVYNFTHGNDGLLEGWSVIATLDKQKSTYGEMLNSINGENIKHMSGTFYESLQLTTAPRILNSVTSIGTDTFRHCKNLTNVTIPNSVTSFGRYVFENCINLTSLNYQGTKSEWNNISLNPQWYASSAITTIHCSDGDITIEHPSMN